MASKEKGKAFRRGEAVEVASAEDGFVGSYYEATVVTDFPGGDYIVRYESLVTDDLSGPLREVVSAAEVRPRPPRVTAADPFRLNDVVDAYDNDGWWVGKITGRAPNGHYYVFFDSTGDLIAYPKARLRIHLEWVTGNWICFSR
ncbi:agenet domain-containing family protein [Striga asiatica]|uniref:Agenet domain-containing family protein n=1 Tax=Striga asiatica TaxID=4170 RepID=A0A5A7RGZ4_STRAF|nr:agenet domain-containing family protein [Striga asiatica]